jgi:hypothetical protein
LNADSKFLLHWVGIPLGFFVVLAILMVAGMSVYTHFHPDTADTEVAGSQTHALDLGKARQWCRDAGAKQFGSAAETDLPSLWDIAVYANDTGYEMDVKTTAVNGFGNTIHFKARCFISAEGYPDAAGVQHWHLSINPPTQTVQYPLRETHSEFLFDLKNLR